MKKLNLLALAVFVGALVWVYSFNNDTTRTIQNRLSAFFAAFKKTGANVQDALTGASEEKLTPEQLRALNDKLAIENAELLLQDAQFGLNFTVARQAEADDRYSCPVVLEAYGRQAHSDD